MPHSRSRQGTLGEPAGTSGKGGGGGGGGAAGAPPSPRGPVSCLGLTAALCMASLLIGALLAEQRSLLGVALPAALVGSEDSGAGSSSSGGSSSGGGGRPRRRASVPAPPTFPLLALQRCLRCNLIGVPGACATVGPDEIVVVGPSAWAAVAAAFYVPPGSDGAGDGPHYDAPPVFDAIPSGALVSGTFRVFSAPVGVPSNGEGVSWSGLQAVPVTLQRVAGSKASGAGWYPVVHADQAWLADIAPPGALEEGADDREVLALLTELTGLRASEGGGEEGEGGGSREGDDAATARRLAEVQGQAARALAPADEGDDPDSVYAPPPFDLRPDAQRLYHAMCGSRSVVCAAGDERCLSLAAGSRVAVYIAGDAAAVSDSALAVRYGARPLSDLVIAPGTLAGYTSNARTGRAAPDPLTVLRGFDAWVDDNVLKLPESGIPPLPVFRVPRRTVQYMWEPGRAATCRVDMPIGGNLGDTFGAHVLPHFLTDVRAALCPNVHLVQSAMRVALQVRQERAARMQRGKPAGNGGGDDLMDPSVVNFYLLLGSLVDFTLPVRGAVIAGAGMRGVDLVDNVGKALPRSAIYPVENEGSSNAGRRGGRARRLGNRRPAAIDTTPFALTSPVVAVGGAAGSGGTSPEDAAVPEWDPHSPSVFPVLRAWVLGVRGPRSREVLLGRYGLNPAVVGDPGVLAPAIFPRTRPPAAEQHPVCFLLHYSDAEAFATNAPQLGPVFPMAGGDKTLIDLFDLLPKCARVASSSLHGVIFAHAFGIPALAFKAPSSSEDDFKYIDYYNSVGVYSFTGRVVPASFSAPNWGSVETWARDVDGEAQPPVMPLDPFPTRRFFAVFETDSFW